MARSGTYGFSMVEYQGKLIVNLNRFDRRFRIYEISSYGETIRTYKRTDKDEIVDDMILAGRGAASY
jgi:hypothetical protein